MAEYLIQDTTLDAIADAINAKTGESSAMTPAEMVTEIESISGGGNPVEKTVYTHTQDWSTNQAGGNTITFFNAYFNKGNGLYYATIENNTVSGIYKAINAVAAIGMTKSNAYAFQRETNDANVADRDYSFLISAGATVTVWFIPKGALV